MRVQEWLEGLPRRRRALLLVGAGLVLATLVATDRLGHDRNAAILEALTPVCLVLGLGGLVRPGVIGRDHELQPGDRAIQVGLAVVGVALGFALAWWRR